MPSNRAASSLFFLMNRRGRASSWLPIRTSTRTTSTASQKNHNDEISSATSRFGPFGLLNQFKAAISSDTTGNHESTHLFVVVAAAGSALRVWARCPMESTAMPVSSESVLGLRSLLLGLSAFPDMLSRKANVRLAMLT